MKAVILAVVLLAGCAATPTGVDEIRHLQMAEVAAERGEYTWAYFYPRGIASINALEPAPWLDLLRQHYTDMNPYAQALEAGKINRDEFALIREQSLKEYRPKFAAAQKTTPYLIGERRQQASGGSEWAGLAIIGGALLGAAIGSAAPPPPPRSLNCVTSQMGAFINTRCY